MQLRINGLTLSLGEPQTLLPARAAALLGLPQAAVTGLEVLRRSLDARRSRPPRFVYLAALSVPDGFAIPADFPPGVTIVTMADRHGEGREGPPAHRPAPPRLRPIVIGCGPAGLFAALTLVRQGIPVLLLERGKPVPERVGDVQAFWERGILNPESHVHFGEGGAGTFSDGKLTTRIRNPYTDWVKGVMTAMGAPAEILAEARPHIGTDRLRTLVMNLRRHLQELGCEIRFQARVTDWLVREGRLRGVVVNGDQEIPSDYLVLAIGQSADDAYRRLTERGVAMETKPFAVGLRLEHPQEVIDRIQYGSWAGHPELPPADYFLTAKIGPLERSVYSFCMCPGGRVIGCAAMPGGVITNGMSCFARDGAYANSAVVVNVRREDMEAADPLAGLVFRRDIETQAFAAGGEDYFAPAQRLTGFLSGRSDGEIGPCSFLPGVRHADLRALLPPFIGTALKEGLAAFGRKMPEFVTAEAMLIGVETRTSSPVRILRGEDGQSPTVRGLFPCGEGAGYSGGIISSALDGIRAAERLTQSLAGGGHQG